MDLLVEQEAFNLSNYFLLPLIRRSAKDFASGNFINSYLDIESFSLVVEVEHAHTHFKDFSGYDFSVEKGSRTFLFYQIPEIFHNDVAAFVDGKYSTFTDMCKTYIRKYGKLPFKQTYSGEIEKSVWLHVIDRTDKLRETLEKQLGLHSGALVGAELASKPKANNFFHNV